MLTKILVEIPNDYIDQARDTSDEVNSYLQKEYGVDPNDWTITPKDVLERALGDPSDRYYEEDGEPRRFDYDDLFNDPDKVFKHFVYEYEQNNKIDQKVA